MASIVLGSIGYMIGGPVGYSIGSMIGALMFPPDLPTQVGPRIDDLKVKSSAYGNPIPISLGDNRIGGNYIWSPGIIETRKKKKIKVGKSSQKIKWFNYSLSALISFCTGPKECVSKVWANGKLIYDVSALNPKVLTANSELKESDYKIRFYLGTEDQLPDSLPLSVHDNYPAHRGMVYMVIENFPLSNFNNAAPEFSAEILEYTTVPAFPYLKTTTPNSLDLTKYWEPQTTDISVVFDPINKKLHKYGYNGEFKKTSVVKLTGNFQNSNDETKEVVETFPIYSSANVGIAKTSDDNYYFYLLEINNMSGVFITTFGIMQTILSRNSLLDSGLSIADPNLEDLFIAPNAVKVTGNKIIGFRNVLFKYSIEPNKYYAITVITIDPNTSLQNPFGLSSFDPGSYVDPIITNNYLIDFSLVSTNVNISFPSELLYNYPGIFVTNYNDYHESFELATTAYGITIPKYIYLVFLATKELNSYFDKLHTLGAPTNTSKLGRYVFKLEYIAVDQTLHTYDISNSYYKVVDYWFRNKDDTAHDSILSTELDFLSGTISYGTPFIDEFDGNTCLVIHDKMFKLASNHNLEVYANRLSTPFTSYTGEADVLYFPAYNIGIGNDYGILYNKKYNGNGTTLFNIISEVILMVNPTAEFDFSCLNDRLVQGYSIATNMKVIDALQPLCDAFGIMIIESNNKYKVVSKDFIPLGGTEIINLGNLSNG